MTGTGRPLSLWLVNQYALRIDQPGITRHATLAKHMAPLGVRTTIHASPAHYWNVEAGDEQPDESGTVFRYTRTSAVESNGVRRVLSMLSFSVRAMVKAMRSADPGGRPDVVMGSSPHPFGALAAWMIAKRYRVPFVLEVRDLWPASLVELMGVSSRHPLIVLLASVEKFLYRNADLVITLLPGSERHIEAVAGRPVPWLWVPNGIDLSRVPDVVDREPGDAFVVKYAGAHGIPNSLHTVLEAAALVADDEGQPFEFVLIGDGKEKASLMSRAQSLGLRNVTFRDPVSKSQLLRELPDADALVITFRKTSLYKDGISPNKVFDYFAAGRPIVIAVDTPLNPVEASGAGRTSPPEDPQAFADALRELRSLPVAERNAMGRAGRTYAELHHDHARSGRRIAGALIALVAGRDPVAGADTHPPVR